MADGVKVHGWCPMGCGETLSVGLKGEVRCHQPGCPEPYAVERLLADPEHEHVVQVEEGTFSMQHPLKERLHGTLFDCLIHARCSVLERAPVPVGRYRVTLDADGLRWERLSPQEPEQQQPVSTLRDPLPAMPEWVESDGPWCLRNWVPFGGSKYDTCFLPPEHADHCRGVHGTYHHGNALPIGRSKMKEEA